MATETPEHGLMTELQCHNRAQSATPLCGAKTRDGTPCRRAVRPGLEYCWQHAHGLMMKWRSLTRNHSISFVFGIVGIVGLLISIGDWVFPQAWLRPNFVAVVPVVWLDRPDQVSFTVFNDGPTAINNIKIQIHDLDAPAEKIRVLTFASLTPHTAITRVVFYKLKGFTVRGFMIDSFAGDEQSRLWVRMANVNGQWLIATSLSRRTGDQQLQIVENVPPQFPRNDTGKVDSIEGSKFLQSHYTINTEESPQAEWQRLMLTFKSVWWLVEHPLKIEP